MWGWLLTIPWTIQFSTNVINTSYILPAALVFFIGFFESVPTFRLRVVSMTVAHMLMGAAIGWLMQIHMSWPLLVPLAGYAWISGSCIADCGVRNAECGMQNDRNPQIHSASHSAIRNPH